MDEESAGNWIGRMLGGATALATFVGAIVGVMVGLDRLGWLSFNGSQADAADGEESAELAVTRISVDVNPEGYTGKCPVNFEFLGEITTTGEGTVTYRWVRSDGEEGPAQTLEVSHGDTHEVETTWMLGEPGWGRDGRHWQQLEILEPVRRASKRAEFMLRCP